jgi:hypothetical protein
MAGLKMPRLEPLCSHELLQVGIPRIQTYRLLLISKLIDANMFYFPGQSPHNFPCFSISEPQPSIRIGAKSLWFVDNWGVLCLLR